jgi:hypothetical protein
MKYVIIISTLLGLSACTTKATDNKKVTTKIEPKVTQEIQQDSTMTTNKFAPKYQQRIDILKKGMIDYMQEGGVSYTSKDVDKCIQLLVDYLTNISKTTTKVEGMKVVKKTVIALNELNVKCSYELIETDQREIICEIIIKAGHEKGFNEMAEDITQEWREW